MIAAERSVAQGVYKLRALFISPLIRYIFLFTQKSQEKFNTDIWRGISKDVMYAIRLTLFSISPAKLH